MAGLYLHIPFCKQTCSYCDFYFTTTVRYRAAFTQALVREIKLRTYFFEEGTNGQSVEDNRQIQANGRTDKSSEKGTTQIDTVYFGGGTPSMLENDDLTLIFETLHQHFNISPDAEVTLEANPDDLSPQKLEFLKKLGVNRLSIGIQSFRDADLALMNRAHNAQMALNCVPMAQAAGFDNLTIDLIYGIPGLTDEAWKANLQQALDLKVPHISAYALTVEEKTLLEHQVKNGKVHMPEDHTFQEHYFALIDGLEAAGFEHYELSNFARPGFRSRHNSSYWHGIPYLGLGPSAHSFRSHTRSWNLPNLAKYTQSLQQDQLPVEATETLSPRDQLNEYLMTGLRLTRGIDLHHILETWGYQLDEASYTDIYRFFDAGWMEREGNWLRLTREGKMVSNEIISDLFVEEGF